MSPRKHNVKVSCLNTSGTSSSCGLMFSSCAKESLTLIPAKEKAAINTVDMRLLYPDNVELAVMTTNISRIILSQTINSLNLHEYAKMNPYEKDLYIAHTRFLVDIDWL